MHFFFQFSFIVLFCITEFVYAGFTDPLYAEAHTFHDNLKYEGTYVIESI